MVESEKNTEYDQKKARGQIKNWSFLSEQLTLETLDCMHSSYNTWQPGDSYWVFNLKENFNVH